MDRRSVADGLLVIALELHLTTVGAMDALSWSLFWGSTGHDRSHGALIVVLIVKGHGATVGAIKPLSWSLL